MVLLFLSWIVMLLFFIPTGIFVKSILKIETNNLSLIAFLGMFLQCFLLSICCFFINIGIEVFVINAILSLILIFYQKAEIKKLFIEFRIGLFSIYLKIILIIILFSSLYKCSLAPFLIDNESYYLQTIKWINEFGFVKGLANLHIFFAQTSPLHVLQAGFNFSFLTNNLNDINGLILVIASLFFIKKFEYQYKLTNKIHWIGIIPVFNILFFQFISQPSPDFVIIVVSQIIFYLFLEENKNQNALKISFLLFLLMFFVKITILPLALLIFIWIYQQKKLFNFFFGLGFLVALVLICKNVIISGFPFYPFEFLAFDVDWKIPNNLFLFITESSKNTGYFENEVVLNPTFYQKIYAWLHLSGLNRFFNLGIISLFILTFFTKQLKKNKLLKILYFCLLVHFVILLLTSPQFRFFLPEFIFFASIIICEVSNCMHFKQKMFEILMILFLFFSMIFVEFLDFKNITSNKYLQTQSGFKLSNLVVPEPNSKYDYLKFEKIKNGNLEYFSPKQNFFFFGTANGNLPCVNKVQIDYLEKYYFIKPQLRTNNLSDGFYSKITNANNE